MEPKRDIVKLDLENGHIYQDFAQVKIGEGDTNGDVFGVSLYSGGAAVDLSGASCVGYYIRSDGVTFALDGATSGNTATVTLPQACYVYRGAFCLSIKVTGGDVVGTVRIVNGTVVRTTTDESADPSPVVPAYVRVDQAQALTDTEKAQARTNIGAASSSTVNELSGALSDVSHSVLDVSISNSKKAGQLVDAVTGATVQIVPDETQLSPLKSVSLAGSTAQNGTPSPASPVPVEGLAGYDQMVVLDGSADESFTAATNDDGSVRFRVNNVTAAPRTNAEAAWILGSYLAAVSYNAITQNGAVGVSVASTNRIFICIADGSVTTVDGLKAYLADRPLTVWYRSAAFDASADQYYAISIEDADGTFLGVGTTEKIAPLYAGDSLDFVWGEVTRTAHRFTVPAIDAVDTAAGGIVYASFPDQPKPTADFDTLAKFSAGAANNAAVGENTAQVISTTAYIYGTAQDTLESMRSKFVGAYLVYPTAAAVYDTVALSTDLRTAAAILSLEGTMTLSGTGTLTVRYAADLKTYIDGKIAAAVAALNA